MPDFVDELLKKRLERVAFESDTSFSQSFDAVVWARAFVELAKRKPEIATDEACMIGWFANSLMRGYDEYARLENQNVGS